MKLLFRLPSTAAVLVIVLAASLPSQAGAKSDREESHGAGRSSAARGRDQGNQNYSRDGGHGSSSARGYANRAPERDRGESRGSGGDNRDWRGDSGRDGSRGDNERDRDWGQRDTRDPSDGNRPGSRGDVRYRQPGPGHGTDQRWRESRGGGDYRPSYSSRTRYRYGAPSYSYYHPRHYYTSFFPRPRFVYRSGFSLGLVIGSVAPYGCRYYDPYCDIGFSSLGAYYDHCNDQGHPDVILLLDARGYPIATCDYQDGCWVVDDCY